MTLLSGLASDPADHARIASSARGFSRVIADWMPETVMLKATPARISREPSARPRRPRMSTTVVTAAAPMIAEAAIPKAERSPSQLIPIVTANAAPDPTPSSPGSARGFRVIACMSAPDQASAAPTSIPARVRGRRTSPTSVRTSSDPLPLTSAMISVRPRGLEPISMLANVSRITRMAAMSATTRRRGKRTGDASSRGRVTTRE